MLNAAHKHRMKKYKRKQEVEDEKEQTTEKIRKKRQTILYFMYYNKHNIKIKHIFIYCIKICI